MAFAACCISAVFLLAVKEILVVHKNRQRPGTFESVGDENKIYEAVKEAFVDVLPSAEVPVGRWMSQDLSQEMR